jgi:N-acetylneuraminic acid mutarotase
MKPHLLFITLFSIIASTALAQSDDIPIPFDLSGTWQTASSIGFTPRYGLTSAVVNGKIYVIGGYGSSLKNTMEVYDPMTNKWTTPTTTGTFTARYYLTSSVVDGKIYVIGGQDGNGKVSGKLEVFDPATNTWNTPATSGTFTPRAALASCVAGNKIYVLGGTTNNGNAVTTVEVFDPSSNTWTTLPGMSTPRSKFGAAEVNGNVYAIGGYNNSGTLDNMEILDTLTTLWYTPNVLMDYRDGFAIAALSNKIYAAGGRASGTTYVRVYEPNAVEWDYIVPTGTFTERYNLSSSFANGKLYTFGGTKDGSSPLNTNEVLSSPTFAVSEASTTHPISCWPNPAHTFVTLNDLPMSSEIVISDAIGRIAVCHPVTSDQEVLDFSGLAAGMYVISIRGRSQEQHTILVKE